MVWGSMVCGESPARMGPRGAKKNFTKIFVNYHLERLSLIPFVNVGHPAPTKAWGTPFVPMPGTVAC